MSDLQLLTAHRFLSLYKWEIICHILDGEIHHSKLSNQQLFCLIGFMLQPNLYQESGLSQSSLFLSLRSLDRMGGVNFSVLSLAALPGDMGLCRQMEVAAAAVLSCSGLAQLHPHCCCCGEEHSCFPAVLLPAASSTGINRGNDLASCLGLVNSDGVFSFLTHWVCKAKWVLVFKTGASTRWKCGRGSCHMQLAISRGDLLALSMPGLQQKAQSLHAFELALTSTLTIHFREFSRSTYGNKIAQ